MSYSKLPLLGMFFLTQSSLGGNIPLPCPEFNQQIPASNATWQNRGPAGYYPEQGLGAKETDDNVIELLSGGAIQDVVEGEDGTWYVATVNGGVWRTKDDLSSDVRWTPVTDSQPVRCSSISAITTGKSVGRPEMVVAGCGASTSSEQGSDWNVVNSGPWGGVMFSTDSGESWTMHDGMEVNYYITSVKILPGDGDNDLTLLVSARSHFYDKDDGGLWRGNLLDETDTFSQVLSVPIFDLAVNGQSVLAAVPYDAENTVLRSTDGGVTFESWSDGISWATDAVSNMQPYYPTVVFNPSGSMAFTGALTVDPNDATNTGSAVFYRYLGSPSDRTSRSNSASSYSFDFQDDFPLDDEAPTDWILLTGGPVSLDDDKMPKDRMAILADPSNHSQMYVVGNGGQVAWRVDYVNNDWISMIGDDTGSSAEPHVDCRNLAFQKDENRLLLVSDGGLFVRDSANQSGGVWRSGNGDINSLEFIDAKYNPFQQEWIAGAQDNFVQVSSTDAEAFEPALGIVGGDGTVTAVDNSFNPPRMFGCIQFLGQMEEDDRRRRRLQRSSTYSYDYDDEEDDDDDDYSGLRMVQGSLTIDIMLMDYFKEESQFPFFVQSFAVNPYAKDAGYNGTKLVLWANASSDGSQQAGFYEYSIPDTAKTSDDIGAPKLLAECADNIFSLVYGGVFQGESNQSVADDTFLAGVSNNKLMVLSSATNGQLVSKDLPGKIADPVSFTYDSEGAPILGPVTHGKVASLAVAPNNANVLAITGWSSVSDNGDASTNETIFLSEDGGDTWVDAFGDLNTVVASVGKVRASSLLLLHNEDGDTALLVGTVNGIYATLLSDTPNFQYSRVGGCDSLPLVLVMGLSYEPLSDTILAATFGRGVYSLSDTDSMFRSLKEVRTI